MKSPTRKQLAQAVEILADHHRGRAVLASLLDLLSHDKAGGLDTVNADAVQTIIAAKFGAFAGSTTEAIKAAIGEQATERSTSQTLTIRLGLANAAFVDGGTEEVRRVLNDVCDRLGALRRKPSKGTDRSTL